MKKIFTASLFCFSFLISSSNLSWASCSGQFNPGEFCGNSGLALGQPGPVLLTPGVLQPISNGTILSNISGGSAAPAANSVSSVFDFIGSTRGSLLYRGAAGWSILTPGTLGQILTANGAGNDPTWGNVIGTVSSVGLSLPSFITVTGSPVVASGTLTGTLATQTANTVFAGPGTGAAAQPTFRALVGADLPNPSSTTLGGVQSLAAVASRWINQISTTGVPSAIQPNFTDIAGSATLSQLPSISNNSILANNSGGTSVPSALSASNVLDMVGATQGMVLYRGASNWSVLSPGTSGQVLTTNGAAANPSWATISGTGTVTNVATGAGLTGGPIVTTGTISLANIANGTVLANTSGGSAVPIATTPSTVLDVIGSATGNVLYRAGGGWQVLAPGTNGQVLTMGASTPAWGSVGSVSNVTIVAGVGIAVTGTCNISTTGTCTVASDNSMGANKYQVKTAGSGTITTPTGAAWAKFTLVGGGGGGSGGGSAAAGTGTAGNPTCLNTAGTACTTPVYQAGGGAGGSLGTGNGGTGGSISGSGTCTDSVNGGDGLALNQSSATVPSSGASGGVSTRGGAGAKNYGNVSGSAAALKSGSGGQGGGADTGGYGGAGGGAGATCTAFIQSPAASYTYTVGASAAGGTAGASGSSGGAGGSGILIAEFGFN